MVGVSRYVPFPPQMSPWDAFSVSAPAAPQSWGARRDCGKRTGWQKCFFPAFQAQGARWLHLVDLDGARSGRIENLAVIERIVKGTALNVEVGGGVRSEGAAEAYFALGCERVVLGTAALREPAVVRAIAARHPGCVVVAVDAKDGFVATEGWLDVSSRTAADVARELADAPLAALLYTDIARDGTQVGPNFEATEELARSAAHPVLASGGVGTLDHLRKLARLQRELGRSDETQKILDHLATFEPKVARQLERETGLTAKAA